MEVGDPARDFSSVYLVWPWTHYLYLLAFIFFPSVKWGAQTRLFCYTSGVCDSTGLKNFPAWSANFICTCSRVREYTVFIKHCSWRWEYKDELELVSVSRNSHSSRENNNNCYLFLCARDSAMSINYVLSFNPCKRPLRWYCCYLHFRVGEIVSDTLSHCFIVSLLVNCGTIILVQSLIS